VAFQVLAALAADGKMIVFWDAASFSLVEIDRRLRGWRQYARLKRLSFSAR
jgi:hypothetical protein